MKTRKSNFLIVKYLNIRMPINKLNTFRNAIQYALAASNHALVNF